MADRAVLYLRVSSKGQADDGTSLETQEALSREYAAQRGYQVVAVYHDVSSGVDSADYRPGIQAVRKALVNHDADILVIWKVDRLARESGDLLTLHKEVYRLGGRMESVNDMGGGPIPNNQMGRMLLFMAGESGQAERDAIVLRTQTGLRQRVADGMPLVGRAPLFGYRYTYGPSKRIGVQRKTGYEIDPETAAIVLRIYEETFGGASLHKLARTLNQEGVPTPTQWLERRGLLKERAKVTAQWSRQMLFQMLQNPSYMGKHTAYRRKAFKLERLHGEAPRRVARIREEGDAKRVELTIPAIVSEELWYGVQTAMKARKAEASRRNPEPEATLLRAGIAYCGHCGTKMTAAKHHDGYRVYVCRNRRTARDAVGPACPGGAYAVRASEADADVWAKVSEVAQNAPQVVKFVETRRHADSEALATAQRESAALAEEIAETEARIAKAKRRMEQADADDEYTLWRENWRRETGYLADLQKRQRRTSTTFTIRFANLERLRMLMDKWLGVDRDSGPLVEGVKDVQLVLSSKLVSYAERRADPLTTLSYDDKREVLALLGVRVFMYASNSDAAKQDGVRWRVQFGVETGDTLLSEMNRVQTADTMHRPGWITWTWTDWLAATVAA